MPRFGHFKHLMVQQTWISEDPGNAFCCTDMRRFATGVHPRKTVIAFHTNFHHGPQASHFVDPALWSSNSEDLFISLLRNNRVACQLLSIIVNITNHHRARNASFKEICQVQRPVFLTQNQIRNCSGSIIGACRDLSLSCFFLTVSVSLSF